MPFADKFWKGKKVLVTGHTGFKGAWMCFILKKLGAYVTGISDRELGEYSLYQMLSATDSTAVDGAINSYFVNICDRDQLNLLISNLDVEIVFHLAAQSLVLESYRDPITTYDTNVIGTLNVLNALRVNKRVRSILSITTDKVYLNKENSQSFVEDDALGGHDPYSASKACADILSQSMYQSYFSQNNGVGLATVRAGNVIGGGDFAKDRLIPDVVRAIYSGKIVEVRNPNAIRPWQHVLDPINGYMMLAKKIYESPKAYSGSFNFGPETGVELTVGNVVKQIQSMAPLQVSFKQSDAHEAQTLKLDSKLAKQLLYWKPELNSHEAVKLTMRWYLDHMNGQTALEACNNTFDAFISHSKTRIK